jgi:hypothetical protein
MAGNFGISQVSWALNGGASVTASFAFPVLTLHRVGLNFSALVDVSIRYQQSVPGLAAGLKVPQVPTLRTYFAGWSPISHRSTPSI